MRCTADDLVYCSMLTKIRLFIEKLIKMVNEFVVFMNSILILLVCCLRNYLKEYVYRYKGCSALRPKSNFNKWTIILFSSFFNMLTEDNTIVNRCKP